MENLVFDLYAKLNDDRLWNENALVDRISDKNNPKNNNMNNVGSALDPFPGPKGLYSESAEYLTLYCVVLMKHVTPYAVAFNESTIY